MRWLIPSRFPRRDKGAVAVIVTVLLAAGVVMGSIAISVDVGIIMAERRQVQNGADASAMALAQLCAKNSTSCAPGTTGAGAVQNLADMNANDGHTQVTHVCARNVANFTATSDICPDGDASALTKCPGLPSGFLTSTAYVEVTTETRDATGSGTTVLTPFARALVGSEGSTVSACARAAWGPAGSTGATLPLIITRCAYDGATSSGTKLIPAPPYTPAPRTSSDIPVFDGSYGNYAIAIEAHESTSGAGDATTCGMTHNGQTYPGGFSWVTPAPGTCSADFDDSGNLSGNNGAAPPQPDCKESDLNAYLGTEVFVPVAQSWTSSGTYTIDGVASFYLAGYANLGGGVGSATVYNKPSYVCTGCNPSFKYVWGWFTSGIKPQGSIGTGPSLGASVVAPAG